MRRLAVSAVLVTLAACSSGGSDAAVTVTSTVAASSTDAATTTVAPTTTLAPVAQSFAEPGPFAVGATHLTLPGGNDVAVWYPAVAGTTGEVTYDVRDYNSDAVKALLTSDLPGTFTIAAGLDAPVAEGAFPIALYSHGFSGINVGSSFLTAHLASYGVIVAAPEHPARDLAAATSFSLGDPASAVTELLATIDLLGAENDRAGSLLAGHVDAETVVAIGHSAGGGTVLGAATDERIDAYVSLASGALGGRDDGSSTTAAPPVFPAKASLFVAGKLDGVVPWDTVTKAAYDGAPSPSTLWVIDGVGHNGFDDFCTFGGGTGIIGLADASGLGPFLDSNPGFRTLGEDGCVAPAAPVEQAWPIIRHVVTAFVLQQAGDDALSASLGADATASFGLDVMVEQK